MKKIIKPVCLLMGFLLLLFFVSGCRGSDPDLPEIEDETILLSELADYTVVYPSNATSELVESVSVLTAKLREIYGVVLFVRDDFVLESVEDTKIRDREILIGATNREQSTNFLSALRANDYGWKIDGGKLVIAGLTEETVKTAIECFISRVCAEKRDPVFFSNLNHSYLFTDQYPLSRIQLGGKDISEYRIVYSSKPGNAEIAAADLVRRAVADECGVLLPIVKDSVAAQEGEILVGKTNRESVTVSETGKYAVGMLENGNVYLAGESATGLYFAARELAVQIRRTTSEDLTVKTVKQFIPDDELTLMSWNLCQQHDFTAARISAFIAQIKQLAPDVVFLQEARLTDAQRAEMLSGLGSGYANAISVKKGEPIAYYNQLNKEMYYNSDLLDVVWSDYFWISETPDEPSTFQYASEGYRDGVSACFERKADGKRFIVVTFHPEWTTTAEMQEQGIDGKSMRAKQYALVSERIAKYQLENPGIPVFLGGDFNAVWNNGSEAMVKAIKADGFYNAEETAFEAFPGPTHPSSGTVIDHILCESNAVYFTRYEAVQLGNYVNDRQDPGTNPADHNPVVAKFVFS